MRKQLAFSLLITLIQNSRAWAQYLNPDKPDAGLSFALFVRLYPLALLKHDFRMGIELPTSSKQALVPKGIFLGALRWKLF
jgi:hypothetical protein